MKKYTDDNTRRAGIFPATAASALATLILLTAPAAWADHGIPGEHPPESTEQEVLYNYPETIEQEVLYDYREYRVGGRLEEVEVIREHGLNENYRNRRVDTVWSTPENELGEPRNMREWTIGAW